MTMRWRTIAGLVVLVASAHLPAQTGHARSDAALLDQPSRSLARQSDPDDRITVNPQMQLVQQMGSRCLTPVGICMLQMQGPIGHLCWCVLPIGPVSGQIIP
jgi:hypothetical protein